MKKLLLSTAIAAVMTLSAGAAQAATDSADSTAKVVVPIEVTKITDMHFGTFTASSTGTIVTNGTITGDVTFVGGVPPESAVFTVTGEPNTAYNAIGSDNTVTLTNPNTSETMQAGIARYGTAFLDVTGTEDLDVRGTLDLSSYTLVAGTYSGQFQVTVAYN